jgi:acyl-CoA synthetase (NDP forming)
MTIMDGMKLFTEPTSVALIGVTRHTGKGAFNILENLLAIGFQGQIYPVNPKATHILGIEVYPEVTSLPSGIDLAVVATPRQVVPQVIRDCASRSIKAAIIVSNGFAEADARGRRLQNDVLGIARQAGMRIIGPNSLGVVNNFCSFTSSFVASPKHRIPVALVCQSGGFLQGFAGFTSGKSIDLGNRSDVDFPEVLEYLGNDHDTKVLALQMESVGDGGIFMQVATKVARKKPILALKIGHSEEGAQAAASHTGSMAGRAEVYQAGFKQAGIIPVDNVDEMGDITRAFVNLQPFKGDRVGIITPTGAGGVMALDALSDHGLKPARLLPRTVERIKHFFPVWSPPANPIDMLTAAMTHGFGRVYRESLAALIDDENVDAVLCISGIPTLKAIQQVAHGKRKPVITWLTGEWDDTLQPKVEETGYRAIYPTPGRAIRALAALREYSCRAE